MRYFLYPVVILLLCSGCQKKPPTEEINEADIIARVGERILTDTELNKIIHPDTKNADSISLANAFIDNWVRDQLMTREASRYFASDFEIEKLVDDYREKLLKFNLEEQIISMRLDTSYSKGEIEQFYNDMKEQFLLKEEIYRCIFAAFDRDLEGIGAFKKEWNAENLDFVYSFIDGYADQKHLDTSVWLTWSEIEMWTEKFSKSRADAMKQQRQIGEESEFFLKVLDRVDKGVASPLIYIEPQLSRMMLHKKKQDILEAFKQELYEKALKNNLIKL